MTPLPLLPFNNRTSNTFQSTVPLNDHQILCNTSENINYKYWLDYGTGLLCDISCNLNGFSFGVLQVGTLRR